MVFHASIATSLLQLNNALKPFLLRLFTDQEINDGQVRVALAYFNKKLKVLGDLNQLTTKAAYSDAVQKIPNNVRSRQARGAAALKKIGSRVFRARSGDRPGADNVLVLITDDTADRQQQAALLREAEKLRDSGVKVMAVGVGAAARENELRSLTSEGRDTLMVAGYEGLVNSRTVLQAARDAMHRRKWSTAADSH